MFEHLKKAVSTFTGKADTTSTHDSLGLYQGEVRSLADRISSVGSGLYDVTEEFSRNRPTKAEMLDIKRATSNDLFSETGRSMTDWGSIMTTLASIASNKCSDEKKHKQRLKAMPDLESVLGQMDQKYNPIMVKYAKALGDKSAEATRAAFLAILQRGDQDIIALGKVDRQWAIEQVKSWSNVQLSKLRNIYAASRGIDLTPAYLDSLKTLDIDYEEDSLLELAAWCLALSHIFQTGNYAALESNDADKAHGLA